MAYSACARKIALGKAMNRLGYWEDSLASFVFHACLMALWACWASGFSPRPEAVLKCQKCSTMSMLWQAGICILPLAMGKEGGA